MGLCTRLLLASAPLTEDQVRKFHALGGPSWLRAAIDAADESQIESRPCLGLSKAERETIAAEAKILAYKTVARRNRTTVHVVSRLAAIARKKHEHA